MLVFYEGFICAQECYNPVYNKDWPDPTIWKAEDGTFRSLSTGLYKLLQSKDLINWYNTEYPPITKETRNTLLSLGKNIWAPDIISINGKRLLYIVTHNSLADCRISVLVENKKNQFDFYGVITDSKVNGIRDTSDPEVVVAEDSTVWLFFGAIGRIHRVKLSDDGLSIAPNSTYDVVAGRTPEECNYRSKVYEGTYLYKHDEYWYLFASSGQYNTYNYRIICGRSKSLEGDFLDKNGVSLKEGLAPPILYSDSTDFFFGPGHNGEIIEDNLGRTFMFYHCHTVDMPAKGSTYIPRPMFLQEILWDTDGWPYFESPKPTLRTTSPIM